MCQQFKEEKLIDEKVLKAGDVEEIQPDRMFSIVNKSKGHSTVLMTIFK